MDTRYIRSTYFKSQAMNSRVSGHCSPTIYSLEQKHFALTQVGDKMRYLMYGWWLLYLISVQFNYYQCHIFPHILQSC